MNGNPLLKEDAGKLLQDIGKLIFGSMFEE